MLVLEVELLTGRYVGKRYDDHASAEWPPHPAKVFFALTAVHFEDPAGTDDARKKERQALDWLAKQSAPAIYASDAARRSVLDTFVPTNDKSVNPSVVKAVSEALSATDERRRKALWRKLEKIGQTAAQPVALTQPQRDRLTVAIESAEKVLDGNDVPQIRSALEELGSVARTMSEERPSKLLARTVAAIARLDSEDKEKLVEQLDKLKRGLEPPKEWLKRAVSVLPASSERKQARKFPSVHAYDPIVQFIWPEDPDERVREGLDALAARVIRLGHPSSLVRLAWVTTQRKPTWIPDPRGAHTLRWVSEGQVEDLIDAYAVHRGTANRILPYAPHNYRRVDDPESAPGASRSSVFGHDWIVFELLGNKRLPIARAIDVAAALRGATLKQVHLQVCGCDLWKEGNSLPSCAEARQCYEKIPPIISGHEIDCSRYQRPHAAFIALPFVGFPHADGSILGVAAVPPLGLVGEERRILLRALGWIQRLTLPPGLSFDVRRVAEPQPNLRTLDPLLWCGEGIVWGTVTPILLDRFPGDLRSSNAAIANKAEQEAQEAIAKACERVNLPRPRVVSLAAPCFWGSPAADHFRRRDRRGLPPRVRVHALIDFGRPVRGPVLLGAARYLGLGLCRPLFEERRS